TAERRDELGLLEAQLGEMGRSVTTTIAELRLERERVEAILRGMVEGVLVTDLDGRVVLVNGRARGVLDIPAELDGQGRALAAPGTSRQRGAGSSPSSTGTPSASAG